MQRLHEPPRRSSLWLAFFGAWMVIRLGVIPWATGDDGWALAFDIVTIVCGLGVLIVWVREWRAFRARRRAHEPAPPERPPWA